MSKMMHAMSEAELLALPAAVDLTTAGRAFGIGRTKAFELARAGEFPVELIRVGLKFRASKAVILEALGVTPAASTGESGPVPPPDLSHGSRAGRPRGRRSAVTSGSARPAEPARSAQKVAEVNVAMAATPGCETPTPFPAERTGGPP